ncbi:nitrogen assimilation response regulator NtrX [Candidatus Nucleicultrix amoebiphila]|jgi:two-component system nitrogen regulation response regulator NtrX|uniref:ATPase AAA n=1 Tax=Candidatus Nucleicultrix amoebiphila FS5 TaxID=1414854 RepID=A0A1W6N2P3_9PROT|nr:sigma-54 dependent transcriptional regulator [Candidatus Nucleicultrix amoebiphila]ARN84144.1 ATPase AAA [Candidatus Nucleicultrix amoebiphila FS5]
MAQDILIVDDEADISTLVSDLLKDEGYETRCAIDGPAAIEAIKERRPSLVVLDIWLGDSRFDGLKVLEIIRKDHSDLPIVMMSGHGTIETAVEAIKRGAYDFIEKPFKTDRLMLVIERAIEAARLRRENQELKTKTTPSLFLSTGSLSQTIEKVAPTSSRVFVSGPSGSGKEELARLVHMRSARRDAPFSVLNCAIFSTDRLESELFGTESGDAIQVGVLEQTHQGTLLLDEVCSMPLETQGKFVRFLQEQRFQRLGGTRKVKVDVRVLASTSENVEKEVEEGRFRQELYYRLSVVPIKVPPLKERKEEIPELVKHFVAASASSHGLKIRAFSEEALLALQSYNWPGNIRQLRNVIDWVLIMSSECDDEPVTVSMLPTEIVNQTPKILQSNESAELIKLPLREAREKFERDYLLAQVTRFAGNISQTANFVGMERSALHRKLKNLQLDRKGTKSEAS